MNVFTDWFRNLTISKPRSYYVACDSHLLIQVSTKRVADAGTQKSL